MKILITGGEGFIGSHIVSLLKKKYNIRSISRKNGIDLSAGSLSYFEKPTKYDVLINAAATLGSIKYVSENPASIIDKNTRININSYKTALEVYCSRIINIQSSCIYPGNMEIQDEEMIFNGRNHSSTEALGSAKKHLIYLGSAYKKQYNLSTTNLILPGVYGPGDSTDPKITHAMNALVIKSILFKYKCLPLKIWGTGNPVREWLYVEDAAKLVELALDTSDLPEIINLGQEIGYSISQTIAILSQILDFNLNDVIYLTDMPDGDKIKILSSKIFQKYFIFNFTAQEKGLGKTIAYYKKKLIT